MSTAPSREWKNADREALLEERYRLIVEKFSGVLTEENAARLQTLDRQLQELEIGEADELDREFADTRTRRLDSSLDRLEQYIVSLKSRAS
jgi:hypothetical protein